MPSAPSGILAKFTLKGAAQSRQPNWLIGRTHMVALSQDREHRAQWQRARELVLLSEADTLR
jgi:hypothetical protein